MSLFSQEGRLLRIKTSLPDDELLLSGFAGREAVSEPFLFEVDLLSENPAVDTDAVLGKPVTIEVGLPDGGIRYIHGIVRRFMQQNRRDPLTAYQAQVVPKLWLLSLSKNSRIFQHKSVPDIVQQVLDEQGVSDVEFSLTGSYPARDYCVQYRESHLDFISRLLQEEGIFYFFRHDDGKHTLVIADANSAAPGAIGTTTARVAEQVLQDEDVVLALQAEHAIYVASVALKDYDPLQPLLSLSAEASGDGLGSEIFDYPGLYTIKEEGDRYADLRLSREEATRQVVRGHGTMRSFVSGHKFDLKNHYRTDLNASYLLLEVRHWASNGDYYAGTEQEAHYRNQFVAIPHAVRYVPAETTPRPVVHGSQTALVVGPSGEEIHVDEHARVKVQFFWDREGKMDEKSSCWVRVSSAWAGKSWGAIDIPRIGQEVVVDFLEGNPDRPLITGRVYNDEQKPPYDLPSNKTQTGLKSRSSPEGGTENFNEIRLEDKKGEELFYIHAEKDKQVVVENDRTEEVGNDETITIGNDRTEDVGNDETITIGNNRTESVGSNEDISIGSNRTESVGANETVEIGGNREMTVSGNESYDIGGSRASSIGANDKLEVGASLQMKAGTKIELDGGVKITGTAKTGIELKVGASKIKITPAGIELSAPMIKIKGTALVELKAPLLKGKADAMLQLQGTMTQVKGDGILILKGGVTMIN